MKDCAIVILWADGAPDGSLSESAIDLLTQGDACSREHRITKERGIEMALKHALSQAGVNASGAEVSKAVRLLDDVRKGKTLPQIEIRAENAPSMPFKREQGTRLHNQGQRRQEFSSSSQSAGQFTHFFEVERKYPNEQAAAMYSRLSGIDSQKRELLTELQIMLFRSGMADWSKKHHGSVLTLVEAQRNRVPLVILEGDVGTGKTALAESIGDALAKLGHVRHVHLLKINTQVRGRGHVGEMTDLIAQAFVQAERRAEQLSGEPVLLLLDEADALAASRDSDQMHHEDKAGLNTLLQRLDNLRLSSLPIAVIFITNRPEDLDPAIRRRAALTLRFERPDEKARGEIFKALLPEFKLAPVDVARLAHATGGRDGDNGTTFTASDITERLLPQALRASYLSNEPLTVDGILRVAATLQPTPPFGG